MIIDATEVQRSYQFQYNGRVAVQEGETEIVIKIPAVPSGKTVVFNVDVEGAEVGASPSDLDIQVVRADEVLKVIRK